MGALGGLWHKTEEQAVMEGLGVRIRLVRMMAHPEEEEDTER